MVFLGYYADDFPLLHVGIFRDSLLHTAMVWINVVELVHFFFCSGHCTVAFWAGYKWRLLLMHNGAKIFQKKPKLQLDFDNATFSRMFCRVGINFELCHFWTRLKFVHFCRSNISTSFWGTLSLSGFLLVWC